ncbi:Ras GTPase-activating protein [Entamoeba marina]
MTTPHIKYYGQSFKELNKNYAVLEYRLMHHLELTIFIGNTLTFEDQDIYKRIIVDLLSKHEKIVPCVDIMLNTEFHSSSGENTILRSNTFCSRVMTQYAQITCREFLKLTLKNILNEMNLIPTVLEIDQKKNEQLTSKDLSNHRLLLQDYCTKIIRSFETNKNELPPQIIAICNLLYTYSSLNFPSNLDLPVTLVNSYLFLRVICPALASPETSGIVTTPLTVTCHRNLLLLTKLLQNIANNVTEIKESYLKETLLFTKESSNFLSNSIISLITTKPDIPITPNKSNETTITDLFQLHSLLYSITLKFPIQNKNHFIHSVSPRKPRSTVIPFQQVNPSSSPFHQNRSSASTSNSTTPIHWLSATPSPTRSPKFLALSKQPPDSNSCNSSRPQSSKSSPINSQQPLTNETALLLIAEFINLLGPSPILLTKKPFKKIDFSYSTTDELSTATVKLVENLRIDKIVYVDKTSKGNIIYCIVSNYLTLIEKNSKILEYINSHIKEIINCIIEGLNQYSIVIDLTNVKIDINQHITKFIQLHTIRSLEERKKIKSIVVFHSTKKIKKSIHTILKSNDTYKSFENSVVFTDTCIDLEKVLNNDSIALPDASIALDRREFYVIKINDKGKKQERILRYSLSSLINIEPLTKSIKNFIALDVIESISIDTNQLLVEFHFYNSDDILDKRIYIFPSLQLLQMALHELFIIYYVRKDIMSSSLKLTVSLSLKSIMLFDSFGIRDIELSSITDLSFDSHHNLLKITWKLPGDDPELLELEPLNSPDTFLDFSRYLMKN